MARTIKPCAVDGCNGISGLPGSGKGFCGKHYQRVKRHGDPNVSLIDRETKICVVEGCGNKPTNRGLCPMHKARMRAHGTTRLEKKETKLEWIARHAGHSGKDCLVWPFSHALHGRGVVGIRGINRSAPWAMCAAAHGDPPTAAHEAAHTCGNGHLGCVNPGHLRWATRKENEADKLAHGTLRRGSAINTSKLSKACVKEIRRRLAEGETGVALAERFNITTSAISAIRTGKAWAWLD